MLFLRPLNVVVTSLGLLLAVGLTFTVGGCSQNEPSPQGEASADADAKEAEGAVAGEIAPPTAESLASEGSQRTESQDESPLVQTSGEEVAEKVDQKEAKPGEDPLVVGREIRQTTEGWWRIIFSVESRNDQYPQDYSAGFIKIGRGDQGKYVVEEVRTNDIINPAKPTQQSNATDQTVRLFFETEDVKFDYAGTLAEGVIRGNLQFSNPRQNLVRLIPAKETEVTDKELEVQRLGPTFGGPEIIGALQGGTDAESVVSGLRDAAKIWSKSPVLFSSYDLLLQNAANFELERSVVEELASEFEKVGTVWGERAGQAAKLNTAIDLMFTRYQIDLARNKLEDVRKEAPELVKAWSQLLEPAEQMAKVEEAWQKVQDGDVQEGLKALQEMHQAKPADALVAYRLAAAEQRHGSKEEALKLFSQLAAQPGGEAGLGGLSREEGYAPPRVAAARLYEETKGSRDGFEDYLVGVYRDTIVSFLSDEQRDRAPIAGDRTVLVELFTGATCPPCVAADIGTEAVEKSLSPADVVVLRYHVHNPGPDPLANPQTQERYDYYSSDILGTPTVFVDGEVTAFQVGGGYDRSPQVYEQLAEAVTESAKKEPEAKLELSAAVEGESLRVSAKASGAEKAQDSLRLRIVIAESHIAFPAMNGILDHSMIVREILGGTEGIAPADGELKYEEAVSLTDLRNRLSEYLTKFEADATKSYGQEFSFQEKPLDLSHLSVVAFLQDDTTREVLQTAVVPIEQEIQLPALEKSGGETDDATGPSLAAPEEAEAAAEKE